MKDRLRESRNFPWLGEEEHFTFPDPSQAEKPGILCSGGNLSPGMLLSAYRQGIFPWFSDGDPLLWWSPDPRFVIFPDSLHVSASMKKLIKKEKFRLTLDSDFPAVINACKNSERPGQAGTWIQDDMLEAYLELHRLGWAHSVEVWSEGRLAGGLYGISLGSAFFGESMFSHVSDASKTALILLAWRLVDEGFTMIDSQVKTPHVARMGGVEISREAYLKLLGESLKKPDLRGNWAGLLTGFPSSSRLGQLLKT